MTYGIDKNAEVNKPFIDSLNNLNREFTVDLQAIKKILEDIMNINYNIADEQLDNLQIETQQLLTTMEYKCKLYYYDILLNPPVSWENIQANDEKAQLRDDLNKELLKTKGRIEEEKLRIEEGMKDITIPSKANTP